MKSIEQAFSEFEKKHQARPGKAEEHWQLFNETLDDQLKQSLKAHQDERVG